NVLIPQKHPRWHQPVDRLIEAEALPGLTRLREGRLDGPQQLLVWSWNRIGPTQTTDPYWGKLLTAYNRLILGDTRAVGVVIFTPYSETDSVADRQRLQAVAQLLIETLNQQSQMEKPAR
ncbi:MAG: exosortase-associated EpsI family protein, partial [Pseudomonadales bacterium]|nr:exosortase-associated EpsI family protein [Pseudomonadales bacterium]